MISLTDFVKEKKGVMAHLFIRQELPGLLTNKHKLWGEMMEVASSVTAWASTELFANAKERGLYQHSLYEIVEDEIWRIRILWMQKKIKDYQDKLPDIHLASKNHSTKAGMVLTNNATFRKNYPLWDKIRKEWRQYNKHGIYEERNFITEAIHHIYYAHTQIQYTKLVDQTVGLLRLFPHNSEITIITTRHPDIRRSITDKANVIGFHVIHERMCIEVCVTTGRFMGQNMVFDVCNLPSQGEFKNETL